MIATLAAGPFGTVFGLLSVKRLCEEPLGRGVTRPQRSALFWRCGPVTAGGASGCTWCTLVSISVYNFSIITGGATAVTIVTSGIRICDDWKGA